MQLSFADEIKYQHYNAENQREVTQKQGNWSWIIENEN